MTLVTSKIARNVDLVEQSYRQEHMNYIIMFGQSSENALEIQKIPRDDGKGMPRLPSPGASSNLEDLNQFQRQFEERGKSERGM